MNEELLTTGSEPAPLPACRGCRGAVERELVTIYPASDLCLQCMAEPELKRLEEELNQVQRIDRDLLPELPRVEGWETGVHYRPSRILSGDFYEVREDDGRGRLAVVIGDVMGKGIPAALLRTGLQGALKALRREIASPARVLEKTNLHFLDSTSAGRFASVFYGALDLAGGALHYANAGHLPPLVRKSNGDWRVLETTGMVLGATGKAVYGEKRVDLDEGDLFLCFSDGITEASNGKGDFFDEAGLIGVVDDLIDRTPVPVMAAAIAEEVSRFAPGDPSDDRTLVMVRRL
jgi:serine phosphatase RsbU (regulator of sigma subunit)